jgi:predicted Zn-dependent protease
MKRYGWFAGGALAALFVMAFNGGRSAVVRAASTPDGRGVLMDVMQQELSRAMASLGGPLKDVALNDSSQPRPYFLSYAVADATQVSISAQFGAITGSNQTRQRIADVQVRLGSPTLDNTHGVHRDSALTTTRLPLSDDRDALARSLWYATNRGYGKALDSLLKVRTETQVHAREEDSSADFSSEKTKSAAMSEAPALNIDRAAWEVRLRALSALFKQYPAVFYNTVAMEASNETDYFVSSEGTHIEQPRQTAELVIMARTRADDGMDLFRVETFEADAAGNLPDQMTLMAKATEMAKNLDALRNAPVTEPFRGPAILSGRAAAVFFHEVLGHRLEGQRQRGEQEGQTFTKLLGKPILPSFLSVSDDPTVKQLNGTWLNGFYQYDDEGQPARRVDLVKDGVLQTFLMSREPIASVSNSNGHGRAQTGHMPTGRQGNLIVTSSKGVSDAELRQMLKDEAKKQGKAYGLYFEDISSGFAVTTRRSPQAFSVIPLVVYRVYVDGRPDELVRGVSIVGTPQTALNRIIATGARQDVFNGECGAESGTVPVSAVAPAMLVSEIETQKQAKGMERPPILPPPATSLLTAKEGQ